ncbi:hypothetical protein GN956_G24016 [Arapaima gigas]
MTVDCTNRRLKEVPKEIPKKTTNLTLTINHIAHIKPNSFQGLENLIEVDMRCNCVPIKIGPKDRMCSQSVTVDNGTFWNLKKLKALYLDGNQLSSIPRGLPPNLSLLSLEVNNIHSILKENLSELTDIEWFEGTEGLQVLDLSSNFLAEHIASDTFPTNLANLQELDLSFNYELQRAVWFVLWANRTTVNIPRLATDVTCVAPGTQAGQSIIFLDLQTCQHNSLSIILYILLTSLVLSSLTLSISSHLFLWDAWYIFHFCIAKLKGYKRLSSQSAIYDAFIVYDVKDPAVSDWVLHELRVHLEEQGDPCLQLCLEERDWMPGCPLIESLSQSIQQSKRTVFVLTNKFLRSGSFKTAFYLAHQRLLDDKADVIFLIFLDKPPQQSKYLRLRRRLYRKSVLEWPTNPQAQQYFWFRLQSAMVTESHKQYSNLFQETL